MANIFNSVLLKKPKRSVFDLSFENKLSFDMAQLIPIMNYSVVPGDKFNVTSEVFLRFAPMIAPVMHRVNCYVHYFYVPYRLLWDNGKEDSWKEFITGGEDGLSQPIFPRYQFTSSLISVDCGYGSLADYLGVNFSGNGLGGAISSQDISLLPFRAYQFIYNEYYRDQNLTKEVQWSRSGGNSDTTDVLLNGTDYTSVEDAFRELTTLRYRAWEKDYFTSALPFVQRGVASQVPITLDVSNLGLSGNVESRGTDISYALDLNGGSGQGTITWPDRTDIEVTGDGHIRTVDEGYRINLTSRNTNLRSDSLGFHLHNVAFDNDPRFENTVRITETKEGLTITPPTINELRLAEHIQKWLERNARGGARYIEQILSHFGVRVPDFRLDRPEYLGGGKTPVVISEVLQTSSTDSTSPQGNMAGHGYAVGGKNKFNYTFDEHGIVLGILSVLPRTNYQQGLDRFWTKFDKFDYYFPEFAHLGEQAVLNKEVYNDPSSSDLDDTFGYQERYAEYKYKASEVHGDFKDTLKMWHLGRIFANKPNLNTSFVQANPSNRIFAVQNGHHMWCQIYNDVKAVRPMPKHAIPSL